MIGGLSIWRKYNRVVTLEPDICNLARRVQKPYPVGFEVGIVVLPNILGLKCGWRLPGRSGVFGNIDLARELVD